MIDNVAILDAFGIVGGDGREFRGGEESGDAAAMAGGGVGIGGARVGLAAGPGGFVELRTVDFGREKVRGVAEVEGRGGGGTEGKSVKLRLRKRRYVYVR